MSKMLSTLVLDGTVIGNELMGAKGLLKFSDNFDDVIMTSSKIKFSDSSI